MTGLLAQKQPQQPPQGVPQQPMPEQPPEEPMPEEGNDEALEQAFAFIHNKLYKQGVADKISKVVKNMPRPNDALAEIALKLAAAADVKTGGNVLEEDLASLGMFALKEVFEIAEASGMKPTSKDISETFKKMVVKWLREQGLDTAEIEQAMSQVKSNDFSKISGEAGGL